LLTTEQADECLVQFGANKIVELALHPWWGLSADHRTLFDEQTNAAADG